MNVLRMQAWWAAALIVLSCVTAEAHEFRTAYLLVEESSADRYDISFRIGARDAAAAQVELAAAPGCALEPLRRQALDAIEVRDYRLDCAGAASAAWIELHGLSRAPYDVLARLIPHAGPERFEHLNAGAHRLALQRVIAEPARHHTLFAEGITHVLGGYDHLAYMLLLYLFLRTRWKQLILGVTTFTVAHSGSLALSALGLLRIPARPVEAVIALTLCYFAVALLRGRKPQDGAPWRWQALILLCGLVHGLGFANSLASIGLDRSNLLWGLASFNLGIECAQIIFVLAAAAAFRLADRRFPSLSSLERVLATLAGAAGACWYLQRVLA
jgi:hypothetical protein